MIKQSLHAYISMGFVGTQEKELSGSSTTQAWRLPAHGPVGLLLQSLSTFDAIMLPSFDVHHAVSLPFNVMSVPWQALRSQLTSRWVRSRFYNKICHRSEFGTPFLMDHDTLRQALKKTSSEDYRLLVSILGLGRWNEQRARIFDATLDGRCQLCHDADGCLAHLL